MFKAHAITQHGCQHTRVVIRDLSLNLDVVLGSLRPVVLFGAHRGRGGGRDAAGGRAAATAIDIAARSGDIDAAASRRIAEP